MQKIHKTLIVDIGNSNTKYCSFDRVFFEIEEFIEYLSKNDLQNTKFKLYIFSTVKTKTKEIENQAKSKLNITESHIFSAQEQKIIFGIYEGIGNDRVAKLIGCQALYPNRNIILFDFGTATTVSIINKNKEFVGGFISLGFTSSLKALSEYCSALDDYSDGRFVYKNDYRDIETKDSKSAIIHGTINAHIGLVNQWIFKAKNILEAKHFSTDNTVCICTGGDAALFIKYFDAYFYDYELLGNCVEELEIKGLFYQ